MRETESLLRAAQNNTIRSNYVKAKIDKTKGIARENYVVKKDEMIIHIVSECRKLVQMENETNHDWV